MAPLQGHTLGQRQKFYNELVNKSVEHKISDIPKINFEDDDVDNMIRIDMACKQRNVQYVLDVLKCDDMLYVSRAVNKSTWLVTEPQYAHIINPKYLHNKLFPEMNAKAVTKLMLCIRRHLKDEVRVKAFYNYVKENNPKAALRWLSNCPLKFIKRIVASRADEIPLKLLIRFFRKSISVVRIFLKNHSVDAIVRESNVIDETKYLLKNKETVDEFIDILFNCRYYIQLNLNRKYTQMLMKTCPDKMKEMISNFYKLNMKCSVDMATFVKHLDIDEIKSFLMNISHGLWKDFNVLTPYLIKLPREEVFNFLSALFKIEYSEEKIDAESLFYAIEGSRVNFSNIYRWYRFAPFDIAFRDIKRFIFAESAPEERHSMLIVLLTCASNDSKHLETVLQYYHDKHINEPYLHKKTFIDSVLSQSYTFRFEDSSWNILNTLFRSSEVYIESTNDVQKALIPIIVRSVIRDQPVHEVVEEKFEIKSLKHIRKELTSDEQDKVFNYLYKLLVKRLHLQSTDSEIGMRKAIELLKSIWTLINDWDKVESHHRFVIDKITELGDVNKASPWIQEMRKSHRKRRKKRPNRYWKPRWRRFNPPNTQPVVDIASIYKMVKSYRKLLFEKSLVFLANEEVLLNALKHDPELLARNKTEISLLRSNDEISLNRFLCKLRIYWPESLATEWTESNTACLNKLSGHRALVRGILTLLPHNKALDFIKMYTPQENKIQWNEDNDIELSIQKHIAKNMHIARPQLSAEVVLWYAKGDYLQHALLSLCTMYYNLRSSDIRKYIFLMLNAPVSLQKHGIRLAFKKFNTFEAIESASEIWKKTKNTSIRAILFTSMFNLLCKEKKMLSIKSIWLVLSSFIDDLNEKENNTIYKTLGMIGDVPLSVVGDFYQKGYLFLKSLPQKVDIEQVLNNMLDYAGDYMEYLDAEFVEKSLLDPVTDILATYIASRNIQMQEILSAYLLCSKDSTIQMQKYNNLLQPVFDVCVPKWVNGKKYLLEGFQYLLKHICFKIPQFVFQKKMIMPTEVLSNMRDAILKGSFCVKEHYIMIRRWQLTVRYIETLDEMKTSNEQLNWESIRTDSTPHIAAICHDFISEDVRTFFQSIYSIFIEALKTFLDNFKIREVDLLKVLYEMLSWEDCPSMYMLVIDMIPDSGWGSDIEYWKKKIKMNIYYHPSEEVKMHYFKRFNDKYNYSVDSDDDTDD